MVAMESDSELDRGDAAPAFDLPGADGDRYRLEDFDVDALLIVFTCNHCPYAQAKIDPLNAIADDYDDVAVVGINPNDDAEYPDDSLEQMRELVADGTIAYDAYLRDADGSVAAAYGAVCTPDPFLFRRDEAGDAWQLAYHGRLDDALNPDDEPTESYARQAIDEILAGEDVSIPDRPSRGCSIKWPEE